MPVSSNEGRLVLAFRFLLLAAVASASTCVETRVDHVDGGVCQAVCGSARPHCDPVSMVCVECLADEHCGAPTGTCDLTTHACVACTGNAACTDPAKSICDSATGACRGCTADADCAGSATTPVCNEASGLCVACTADTEVARCGGTSCDRDALVCTSTVLGSVATCGNCQGDSECGAGLRCVERWFQAMRLGAYCLPEEPTDGCGSTTVNPGLLPYRSQQATTSVDGAAVTICSPRESISCEAIRAFSAGCTAPAQGTRNDACGNPVVGDGNCLQASDPVPTCTYACLGQSDCRSGLQCNYAPAAGTSVCF